MRNPKHSITIIIISLFGFALVALLISLGFWQLHRAEYKRQLLATFAKRQLAKPVAINTVRNDPAAWQYQHVKLQGHFDNQHSFLLDNRFHQHRIGYQVLTPFILKNSKVRLLVNRGWVPAPISRKQLPQLPNVSGKVTLQGLVYRPLKKMLVLKQIPETTMVWPNRIQRLDFPKMAAKLDYPLESFSVLLNADQPHGFIRDWKPVIMPAAKHTGYAVQWFALGATLLIIMFVMFYRMSRQQEVDHHASKPNLTHTKQTV